MLQHILLWTSDHIKKLENEISSFKEANEIIALLIIEHRKQNQSQATQDTFSLGPQILQMAIGGQPLIMDEPMADAITSTDPM